MKLKSGTFVTSFEKCTGGSPTPNRVLEIYKLSYWYRAIIFRKNKEKWRIETNIISNERFAIAEGYDIETIKKYYQF